MSSTENRLILASGTVALILECGATVFIGLPTRVGVAKLPRWVDVAIVIVIVGGVPVPQTGYLDRPN